MTPRELCRLREAVAIKRAQIARGTDDPIAFASMLGFEADPWQQRLLRATKNVILNCSRQAGKSTAASALVVHRAVTRPRHLALLISPSERQSTELFRKVRAFLGQVPSVSLAKDNEHSAQLSNGSRIVSLPSSAETIRGFSAVNTLIEDESAFVDDELNMTVRPMLAVSGGQMILMSTPNGRRGHFFDVWHDERNDWHRERVPCWDVSRIPRDFLEEQRRVMGEMFRQEFECEFINAATGRVYEWDETLNVIDVMPTGGSWTWMLGLDFGIRDRNAATVIGWRKNDPCLYIPRSYRFPGTPDDAAREVRALEKEYEFTRIVGDVQGLGAVFGEDLAKRFGIPVEAAKKADKLGGVRLLNGDLRLGRIKVLRSGGHELLDEWRDLPWAANGQREAEGYTADASDSALYVYRATHAYHEREPAPPETLEQRQVREEAEMVARAEEQLDRQEAAAWWEH